jgi:hypothetical protein
MSIASGFGGNAAAPVRPATIAARTCLGNFRDKVDVPGAHVADRHVVLTKS